MGAYRGMRMKKNTKHPWMESIFTSFAGFLLYASPLFMPFFIYKELVRLEHYLRGIPNNDDFSITINFDK